MMDNFRNTAGRAGLVALTLLLPALPAIAASATLTFEGAGSHASLDNFYNGGTDSQGHVGVNYGVGFAPGAYASIDSDAGGGGNFANEPSASTVLFFTDTGSVTLNVSAGFTTAISFFYTSSTAAAVYLFDGLNLGGNLLGSVALGAQSNLHCAGDPTGSFCNWTPASVSFAGTARSAFFTGTAFQTGYDDINFRNLNPASDVPEPATWALFGLGFAATGFTVRRRAATQAA